MRQWLFCCAMLLLAPAYGAWQGEKIQVLEEGLQQPSAVAVGDAGEVFVLDGVASKIVMFDAQGKRIHEIKAPANQPMKLAMDLVWAEDKLVVADTGNHRLLVFSRAGRLLESIALSAADVDCENSKKTGGVYFQSSCIQPSEPVGLSYQSNTLYWSDRNNHRVCKTTLSDKQTDCWGEYGRADDQFRYPFMLVSDKENYLYVVDVLNASVKVFNYRGSEFGSISAFGLTEGALFRPNGITVGDGNSLFVSDTYLGTISSFRHRHFTGVLRDTRGEIIHFDQPVGLLVKNKKIFVAEMGKGRVVVYQLRELQHDTDKKSIPKISRQDCVMCHIEWADGSKTITISAAMDATITPKLAPKVAEQKMCLSCHHGAVIDSRLAMMQGKQHPDYHHPLKNKDFETPDKRKDPLDKALPFLQNSTPYCGSCHTPHAQHKEETGLHPGHNNSWMRLDNSQGKLCKSCHESYYQPKSKDEKTGNHPVNIHLQKPPGNNKAGYAKDFELQKGLPVILKKHGAKVADEDATTCESCHLLHGAKDKGLLVLSQGEICSECHQAQTSKDKKSAHKKGIHPVNIEPEEEMTLNDKKVKQVECNSCHDVHGGLLKGLLQEAKTRNTPCEDCHARQYSLDKKEARNKGIHPVHIKLDKPLKFNNKTVTLVECKTCHSVHNGKPNTPVLVKKNANQMCASCHPRQHAKTLQDARRQGVHPVNIKLDKPVVINNKKLTKVDCLSCHSVHHGKPNTPALVQDHKTGKLCKNCHQSETAVINSDHNLQRTARHSKNLNKETPVQAGVCGSCHSMHKAPKGADRLFVGAGIGVMAKKVNKRDRSCFACHRDKGIARDKAVKKYTHPIRDLVMKSDPRQFPLVDKYGNTQKQGQIACITCHNPHRWMPKGGKHSGIMEGQNEEGNVLNSFLHHKSPQGSFCVDCHGIESQIRFKYYHDKRGRTGNAEYIQ